MSVRIVLYKYHYEDYCANKFLDMHHVRIETIRDDDDHWNCYLPKGFGIACRFSYQASLGPPSCLDIQLRRYFCAITVSSRPCTESE